MVNKYSEQDSVIVRYLMANGINADVYSLNGEKIVQNKDTCEILVKAPRVGFYTAFNYWRIMQGDKLCDIHQWCHENGCVPF